MESSNEHWVSLAADQLGESEPVIMSYLQRGIGNELLVNLTHITRQIVRSLKYNKKMTASSATILRLLSNFDVQNTVPELQQSFLSLWNEIGNARRDVPKDKVLMEISATLFDLYKALLMIRRTRITRTVSNVSP